MSSQRNNTNAAKSKSFISSLFHHMADQYYAGKNGSVLYGFGLAWKNNQNWIISLKKTFGDYYKFDENDVTPEAAAFIKYNFRESVFDQYILHIDQYKVKRPELKAQAKRFYIFTRSSFNSSEIYSYRTTSRTVPISRVHSKPTQSPTEAPKCIPVLTACIPISRMHKPSKPAQSPTEQPPKCIPNFINTKKKKKNNPTNKRELTPKPKPTNSVSYSSANATFGSRSSISTANANASRKNSYSLSKTNSTNSYNSYFPFIPSNNATNPTSFIPSNNATKSHTDSRHQSRNISRNHSLTSDSQSSRTVTYNNGYPRQHHVGEKRKRHNSFYNNNNSDQKMNPIFEMSGFDLAQFGSSDGSVNSISDLTLAMNDRESKINYILSKLPIIKTDLINNLTLKEINVLYNACKKPENKQPFEGLINVLTDINARAFILQHVVQNSNDKGKVVEAVESFVNPKKKRRLNDC